MFRKRSDFIPPALTPAPSERVTSVIGAGVSIKGILSGSGGVRIEGAFEGEIALRGLLVIGESGRVTCERLRAGTVVVAGAVRGDILAEKLEIRKTGRVWGNVVTAAFATEEGAFLRGQIRMEEKVDLGLAAPAVETAAPGAAPEPSPPPPHINSSGPLSHASPGIDDTAPLPTSTQTQAAEAARQGGEPPSSEA